MESLKEKGDVLERSTSLAEEEFFKWAIEKLPTLDELVIVSHTPIIFFEAEQIGTAKNYFSVLEQRLQSKKLPTTYYFSSAVLDSIIFQKLGEGERLKTLKRWKSEWASRSKADLRVVETGHFPRASLWIGRKGNSVQYTLIKLQFEDENVEPLWLGFTHGVSRLNILVDRLREDSEPFLAYLETKLAVYESKIPYEDEG